MILCAVANPLQSCRRRSRIESLPESTRLFVSAPAERPCGRISRQRLHHTRCLDASSCLSAAGKSQVKTLTLPVIGRKAFTPPFFERAVTHCWKLRVRALSRKWKLLCPGQGSPEVPPSRWLRRFPRLLLHPQRKRGSGRRRR